MQDRGVSDVYSVSFEANKRNETVIRWCLESSLLHKEKRNRCGGFNARFTVGFVAVEIGSDMV